MDNASNLIRELNRAKALFQLRQIKAVMGFNDNTPTTADPYCDGDIDDRDFTAWLEAKRGEVRGLGAFHSRTTSEGAE